MGRDTEIPTTEHFVTSSQLPVVLSPDESSRSVAGAPVDEVAGWITASAARFQRLLDKHGAILLRGFRSIAGVDDFETIARALSPTLMDYVGGTSPRTTVKGKVLVSTEMPPTFSIPLHQEMSYTNDPPDRVAFFCETPPEWLGRTPLADMRAVTRRLPMSLRQRFEARGVRLRRALPGPENLHKKAGVAKSWVEVFGTDDPREAERIAREREWDLSWLKGGYAQLVQELRPATREHPRTGERVWFNQAHIFGPHASASWAWRDRRWRAWTRVRWQSLTSPALIDDMIHDDGTPVSRVDVATINRTLDEETVSFPWQKSDVLVLDNILAAHGRTPYRGQRRILATLLRDAPAAAVARPGPGLPNGSRKVDAGLEAR